MEGVGEFDAEGFFDGFLPWWREGDAVGILRPVPQFGVALAAARGVAAGVPAVGVGHGRQGDVVQAEALADVLEVGQAQDVLDAGEGGRDRQVKVALPALVMVDGFGVAGDESRGGFDEGGDAAAQATELGFTSIYRMYRMIGFARSSFDRLRMSGYFGVGIATARCASQ